MEDVMCILLWFDFDTPNYFLPHIPTVIRWEQKSLKD